jgi:hypothetical protein
LIPASLLRSPAAAKLHLGEEGMLRLMLGQILVFVDKFFLELTLEKDFDEGYTLNDIYNEMAHVAAVK